MGSLEKCKTINEIHKRLGVVGPKADGKGTISAKLDGASLSLHYENGRFVRAVTRGKTETGKGKVVTANALMIPSIPKTILSKDHVEVRGECIILLSDWTTIADKYSNPRNAASGGISCQNPKETSDRKITFVACKVIVHDSSGILRDTQPFDQLKEWGFVVPKHIEVDLYDIKALAKAIEDWLATRSEIPYWNDGIVIRIKNDEVYNELGMKSVCPNGAVAYKFENETAESTIRDIVWETGRLGFVTPVALFDMVNLGGAEISRCTLNNPTWMKEHGNPSIGAKVVVAKMNDIIPNIVKVVEVGSGKTNQPTECPSCGTALAFADVKDGEGAKLQCTNRNCKAKLLGTVLNMLRKFEVKGTSDSTLDKMFDAKLIQNPWDIFDLTVEQLVGIGFGRVESSNIISSLKGIEAKASHIVAACGIESWGRRMFDLLLANGKPTFTNDKLLAGDFKYDELVVVKGIGPSKARILADAFAEGEYGRRFLSELLKRVKPTKEDSNMTKEVGGKLAGKSFLITGTLSQPRKYFEALIVENQGKLASGVSKNLNFLVAGAEAGSKLSKAQAIGVPVIDEQELLRMIG
jgi:DNA ligase (NAD+)